MTGGPAPQNIRTRQIVWSWQGHEIALGLDEAGDGSPVLMLPALNSVSTRREMHPLMRALARQWHVLAPDWPGFGDQSRPPIAWTPDALSAFLEWLVREQIGALHATVAAGHAASYALNVASRHPGLLGRLALLAPTWRGPLPTMAGGNRPFFARIRRAVGRPILGPALYRLNVNPLVVRMMLAGHVYEDVQQLPRERMQEKRRVIAAENARFGSVAFVTGGLDRIHSRAEFLDLARAVGVPVLVAFGAGTPARSRAEMEALAAMHEVRAFVAPQGKLGFHEEYPELLESALQRFLAG